MRARFAAAALVCLGCGLIACEGDDDSDNGFTSVPLDMGEGCAPSDADACPAKLCEDVVSGQALFGNVYEDYDRPAIEGTICTKTCTATADCAGIDFAATNDLTVESETWTCADGICAVHVTAPEGGGSDPCNGCGGAFCAGDCIGCPQC